jgi:hypothetical protein
MITKFPFMLRLSKHSESFFSNLLDYCPVSEVHGISRRLVITAKAVIQFSLFPGFRLALASA